MDNISTERLKKIYTKCSAIKQDFWNLYEKGYRLAIPERNLYNNPAMGQRQNKNYSSIGAIVLDGFVSYMQSNVTPPFMRWAELSAGEGLPEQVKDQLNPMWEEVTRIGFEMLNASNFYVMMGENYQDLGIGTGTFIVHEGDDNTPLIFSIVHPKDILIHEDLFGRPKIKFVEAKIEACQIKEIWPDAQVGSELHRKIISNPLEEVEIIYCTYKEKNHYKYLVIYKCDWEIIVNRKMTRDAIVTTRLGKVPGEPYGRGPIIRSIEDLQTYDKGKEYQLISWAFNTFGMYTVADNSVINPNNMKLQPGMFLKVSNNGTNPSIAPLPGAGNLQNQQIMLGELKQDIEKTLLNDRLPPETGAVRSATEYDLRYRTNESTRQPYVSRISYELVQPVWQNIVSLMWNKEMLPEDLPAEFTNIDNLLTEIRITSPIAKQQGIVDMNNLMQALQAARAMAGEEAVSMAYKLEDIPDIIARDTGITKSLKRSDEERQQMNEQRQAMAMMQEMANAQLPQ